MLPALSALLKPSKPAGVCPSPSLLQEGLYHCVATQQLAELGCHSLGDLLNWGRVPGRDAAVGKRKVLRPAFLLSVSPLHAWVARSLALCRRNARLERRVVALRGGRVAISLAI